MANECLAAPACGTRMWSSARSPAPMHVAAEMFTPASLIAAATSASAPGVFSISMTRSTAMGRCGVSLPRKEIIDGGGRRDTMKAIVQDTYGSVDVLEPRDIDRPE